MDEPVCPKDGVHTVAMSAVVGGKKGLDPGAVIGGRYRVERLIGKGAMGAVYEAVQLSMHRTVALKVLNKDVMKEGQELRRFYQEARSASQLKHPNVVGIYDFGVDDENDTPFIAMELIEGRSLRDVIRREAPMSTFRACTLLSQVAKALAAAHANSIVHRDLKPDNIMVGVLPGGDEHVTVLDFGIAKVLKQDGGLQVSLTASGALVGTPRYMSPEQVQNNRTIEPRTDLYALGCILHELILSEPPFSAEDPLQLMMRHANAIPPPLPEHTRDGETVPPDLIRLHASLLAKQPEQRPDSASIVSRALLAIARGEPMGETGGSTAVARPSPEPIMDAESSGMTDTQLRADRFGLQESVDEAALDSVPPGGGRRRWGWAMALALVAAGLGGVGFAMVNRTGEAPDQRVAASAGSQARPPVLPEPPTAPEAEPDAGAVDTGAPLPVEMKPPSEPEPPAPMVVLKTVTARPFGYVYVDDERLGATPMRLEVPEAGLDLVIRRAGYLDARVRLMPDGPDAKIVRLRRRPAPPPPLAPR